MNFENAVKQMIKGNKVRNTDWGNKKLHLFMADGVIYFANGGIESNKTAEYFSYDFNFGPSVVSNNWTIYEEEPEYISLVEMIQRNDGCYYCNKDMSDGINYHVENGVLKASGYGVGPIHSCNEFKFNEKVWYKVK